MVRGRMFVRFLIIFMAATGMLLAPVVTWPSSGRTPTVVPASGPMHGVHPYADEAMLR